MSNTRNMNQANNFWDFVASLQNNQGASPFAEGRDRAADFDPFQGQEFWAPWMSQRGRGSHRGDFHGHPGHHHAREGHRPPPPPQHDGTVPPAPPAPHVDEPSRSPSPPTPPRGPSPHQRHSHRGPSPHHHPHRGPSPHQRHAHRGPSPHHHGPHHHGPGHRRGRGGGPGRGGHRGNHHGPRGPPPPFLFDLNALAEAFAPAIFGDNNPFASAANPTKETSKTANTNTNDGTFTPTIDLFSNPQSYILHTSLPGAKKSDVDVSYSSTRNSITISGVIARPDVSEETMNCLIVDERTEVGLFEREVKLEEGIKVDEERIGAKLEDGVLRVVVPKVVPEEEEEGWESVRKVELE